MDGLLADWSPDTAEKQQNVNQFGEPNPWTCIDEQPVYEVLLVSACGREVRFTTLKTYQHSYTDETKDWVRPWGDCQFIFEDEWPEDDVLEDGMVTYRPIGCM